MKFGTLYSYWGNEWNCEYTKVAKKVADLGFDILEVGADHLVHMSNVELDELKDISKSLGLTLTSNIGPAKDKDVAAADPKIRRAGIEYLTNIMKAMDRIDSRSIVGVMYSFWPCDFQDVDKPAAWNRGVQSVKELGKIAESLGIEYCMEVVNRFETFVLNTSEEAIQYCKDVDNKNVKILLDTFHMNIEEDNIPDAIRLAGNYLGHVHVGEGNRKLPGNGHLPWDEIGQSLRDIHYNKGIVMEPFLLQGGQVGKDIKVWRDLSGGVDEAEMDRYIKESLRFLRSKFLSNQGGL
ncbi:MAG: sugar phosphate isomerase/epimerase [Clostridia bacterium]|jgi:D-psicose/D-tagatose/L-ribulose 3-epimerase|nr:sugar phosphate isomerase/epimerase [Clostridia bacterium]